MKNKKIHMTGTMTNPMKEIFRSEWKIGFLMYPFVLYYLFVVYMFAQKLSSNYPDKELLFSPGCHGFFISDFPP